MDGVNNAGLDFHRTLNGNAVSSPLSIGVAFSLVRAGASGATGPTVDSIFGFPEGQTTHEAASSVLHQIEDSSAGTTSLGVATRLYSVTPPRQDFLDNSRHYYGMDVFPWTGSVVDDVNGWVK